MLKNDYIKRVKITYVARNNKIPIKNRNLNRISNWFFNKINPI